MDEKWQGCYGERVSYNELDVFIEDAFFLDDVNESLGAERFSTCVWGHTGIGKTSCIKQLASRPVNWRGTEYPGYDVRSVPIAQFEEMGDLHGLPDKHVLVKMGAGKKLEERWVSMDVLSGYQDQGWSVDSSAGVRTRYAAPDWVPVNPGPCVFILDDFNRAGGRIIKGLMQFLQEYGLMSWKLPPGCHIVLTANPDEQDYFVTTIDPAVLQRFRSCTLRFDAKEWAIWAARSTIAPQIISFVLAYPEMVCGGEGGRTSPRSLAELGRFLKERPGISWRRLQVLAASVLDDSVVNSLLTFIDRDFEMIVSPEEIVAGDKKVLRHLADMMTRKEKRVDVVGVTCDRLFAHLSRPDVEANSNAIENVQSFLTCEYLEPDMRYNFVDRLNRASKGDGSMEAWFMGNSNLMKLIMDVI